MWFSTHLITDAVLWNTSSQVRIKSQDTLVNVVVIVGHESERRRGSRGANKPHCVFICMCVCGCARALCFPAICYLQFSPDLLLLQP